MFSITLIPNFTDALNFAMHQVANWQVKNVDSLRRSFSLKVNRWSQRKQWCCWPCFCAEILSVFATPSARCSCESSGFTEAWKVKDSLSSHVKQDTESHLYVWRFQTYLPCLWKQSLRVAPPNMFTFSQTNNGQCDYKTKPHATGSNLMKWTDVHETSSSMFWGAMSSSVVKNRGPICPMSLVITPKTMY